MTYRLCRSFHVESGHMLSKHPADCKFPHGHSREISVVLSSTGLDQNEMVVDFKQMKVVLADLIDRFDHSMAMNSDDPSFEMMSNRFPSAIVRFESQDPTTEVLAKFLFDSVQGLVAGGALGNAEGLTLERVRVTETPTTWAEYGI